ncbi:unnamed protein product [Clonostachys rosea]|uniref:Zn(2)-C6 fungal-type domain-containing protein n=1 Tax=Bionectria ochroleuca TaxID=29856 RepID=A0ABY6UDL4_BIOOC|nr:unnamed protein product [Clonostachys rosea]
MASKAQLEVQGRKPTRRSRYGCRNCKLRKLKCDETKPQCKKCCSFGVVCNFIITVSDLQPVADDSVRPSVALKGVGPRLSMDSAIWTSNTEYSYQLNTKCQDFLTRYLGRSLITPDEPTMAEVNRKLLALTFTHPFLMHASLAVAFAYDRHLDGLPGGRRSVEECYHRSRSTALFNRRLREPIQMEDKDPIWGTAVALALLSFATPDVCVPEESWPMKASGSSDLEWLRMSNGKMSLWRITDPLRPNSLFHVMAPAFAQMNSPLPEIGIYGISSPLASVCNLDCSSNEKNNPYFKVAHAVSQILDLPDSQVTTGEIGVFPRSIHESFKYLLEERDPIAVLLLYLWYRKASRSMWWIELRARVECPAICLYLQTYHKENHAVHEFLPGGSLARR